MQNFLVRLQLFLQAYQKNFTGRTWICTHAARLCTARIFLGALTDFSLRVQRRAERVEFFRQAWHSEADPFRETPHAYETDLNAYGGVLQACRFSCKRAGPS